MSTPDTEGPLTPEYARIVDDLTYRYDGVFSRDSVLRAVEQARDQLLAAATAEGKIVTTVPEILSTLHHS